MQKQRTAGTKPHKRNSGSFSQPHGASLASNRTCRPQRDSVPLAENPYMRSSSSIYSGGERAIFRKQGQTRRNAIVLCSMVGICIIMAGILIGFSLGKGAALAEAGTTANQGETTPAVVSPDEREADQPAAA